MLNYKNLKLDYYQYRGLEPSIRNICAFFLFNPGFRAVCLLRIQSYLQLKKKSRAANLISNLNQILTGAEFTPGCQVGPGLVVRHPSGIVIGGSVRIGQNLVIHQGVTIGEKFRTSEKYSGSPIIGNNVNIGTNSVIAGEIRIGDNIVVGAISFVNKSFEESGVIAGVPAKYLEQS